jgi:predicted transglutaminase-like cysteine proteinase
MLTAAAFGLVLAGSVMTSAAVASSARAPLGYQLMCLKTPQACKGGGSASVKATEVILQTLKRVNAQVNRTILPVADGYADVWKDNATSGDCDVYVMAKRRALIQAGVSASALRIAYVKTRRGEGHAVLVVKTSKGDLVLDNLTSAIKPLSQAGYSVISMSSADPAKWI